MDKDALKALTINRAISNRIPESAGDLGSVGKLLLRSSGKTLGDPKRQMLPGTKEHAEIRDVIKRVKAAYPKESSAMNIIHSSYFDGFRESIKEAAGAAQAVAEAAPKVEGLAEKLVATLRKRPIMTAATAAAAGAGVATGLEEAKENKKDQERKREQVRELLMARLSGA